MNTIVERYKETFKIWNELSKSKNNGPKTIEYIHTLKNELDVLKIRMSLEELQEINEWLKEEG